MGGDAPSAGAVDAPLTWTVHLARRDPRKAVLAVLVIGAGACAAAAGFRSGVAAVLTALLLAGSVSDFLLPVHYRLSRTGVEARGLLFVRRMEWRRVRRAVREAGGVKLSPLPGRSRLEAYRGIYLWFQGNEAAVTAAIAEHAERVRISEEPPRRAGSCRR